MVGVFSTPILLIVFNRPDITQRVFDSIRQARPRQLFVAADAPRANISGERELCEETRYIATSIDWDCQVHTLFRDQNLGCGLGVSSAITWFFENVEEGIILEDDCLPNPTFFHFCEELLNYYRYSQIIMHVSGNNFLYGKKRGNASYYFSNYTYNWGWATWRRAWKFYEYHPTDEVHRLGEWDCQWRATVAQHGGLAVLPNVNLVTNIGCGREDATHSTFVDRHYANLPACPILFPIVHSDKFKSSDWYTDYSPFIQEDRTPMDAIKHVLTIRIDKLRKKLKSII